jgi:DNA-binding winged helix-turn-helix (wHTH) protein/TolB-like protein
MAMSRRTRFGAFEFDTATGELRREGREVRLQSQPAQVLRLLVEHAGEVVTRDTLRAAIWGDDTFVDFDKGLNFAIGQVRAALGDSAEAPTYVRTFPKRGYQFIAPVEEAAPAPRVAMRRSVWIAATAFGLVLVAAAGWMWQARGPGAARTIAIVPFDNETGASDLDGFAQNLTDSVVAELTASGVGRYAIVGNAAALRVPRARRDLVSLGASLHAGYVVIGQIQRSGPRIRVLAHLIRLPAQTHVWVTRVERTLDDPSSVTSEISRQISSELLGKL